MDSAPSTVAPGWLEARRRRDNPPVVLDLGKREQPKIDQEQAAGTAAAIAWRELAASREVFGNTTNETVRQNLQAEIAALEAQMDRTRDDLLHPEALADKKARAEAKAARSRTAAPEGTPVPPPLVRETDDEALRRLQAEAEERAKNRAKNEDFIAELKARQAARENPTTAATEQSPESPTSEVEGPPQATKEQEQTPEQKAEAALAEVQETHNQIRELTDTLTELRRGSASAEQRQGALAARNALDQKLETDIIAWTRAMAEGKKKLSGEVLLELIAQTLETRSEYLPVTASDLEHPQP